MKIRYKLIIIIIIEIMLISVTYTYKQEEKAPSMTYSDVKIEPDRLNLYEERPSKFEIKKEYINGISKDNLLGKMYYVNDENILYTLSPKEISDDNKNANFQKYASDALKTVLLLGYPYRNYKELGLNSNEEAYMATQIAVWEVADRTSEGEIENWESTFIESIREKCTEKNVNLAIFDVAREIVRVVEKETYGEVASLVVDTEDVSLKKASNNREYYTIGPYTVKTENVINSKYEVIVTTSENEEIEYEIVDEYSNTINELEDGQKLYVQIKKEDLKHITIHYNAKAYVIAGMIISDKDKNQFFYLTTLPTNLGVTTGIN